MLSLIESVNENDRASLTDSQGARRSGFSISARKLQIQCRSDFECDPCGILGPRVNCRIYNIGGWYLAFGRACQRTSLERLVALVWVGKRCESGKNCRFA